MRWSEGRRGPSRPSPRSPGFRTLPWHPADLSIPLLLPGLLLPTLVLLRGVPQTRGFGEIAGELFSLRTLHVVEGAKQNRHLDPDPVSCLAEEGLRCVPGLVGMGAVEVSFLPPLCPPCSPASLGQGQLTRLGLQDSPASRGCQFSQAALLPQILTSSPGRLRTLHPGSQTLWLWSPSPDSPTPSQLCGLDLSSDPQYQRCKHSKVAHAESLRVSPPGMGTGASGGAGSQSWRTGPWPVCRGSCVLRSIL